MGEQISYSSIFTQIRALSTEKILPPRRYKFVIGGGGRKRTCERVLLPVSKAQISTQYIEVHGIWAALNYLCGGRKEVGRESG